MTGARSAAESRARAMAKLFNNAGDKPILPSILKPPIATAKPAHSNAPQRHGPRVSVSLISRLWPGVAHAAITMAPSIPRTMAKTVGRLICAP
jgi:hypothetical protein